MKLRTSLPLLFVVVLLASAAARSGQQQGDGPAAPPPDGTYYALVVGNDDYESLPKLATAARDARAVERLLREWYGFRTRLLVNATRAEIIAALADYRREPGADASLLVYYAGRGQRDAEADRAYWLPVEATREDVSKRLATDEITNAVRAAAARHVLVISDSCYSGARQGAPTASPTRPEEHERFVKKMAAGRSRTLMASGGDEPSAEGDGVHSVFAAALMRGLRRMKGPRFTASELFVEYVASPVAGRTGRIPVYDSLGDSGPGGGDFVFTRIRPDPVPLSCYDMEPKAALYRTFIDNFKGGPEQQKLAYYAGKDYLSKYGDCTDEEDGKVNAYLRAWTGKYEEAVRIFNEHRRERP